MQAAKEAVEVVVLSMHPTRWTRLERYARHRGYMHILKLSCDVLSLICDQLDDEAFIRFMSGVYHVTPYHMPDVAKLPTYTRL